MTYSHTHGAPAVTPFAGAPVDGAYLTWLEGRLALAVAEATRALQPVTVGVGEGSARLNVNRRKRTAEGMVMRANPQGAVDRRVRVLRLSPHPRTGPRRPRAPWAGAVPAPDHPPGPPLLLPLPPHGAGGQQPALQRRLPRRPRRFVERAFQTEAPATGEGQTRALFLPPASATCARTSCAPERAGAEGAFREGNDYELTVLGRRWGAKWYGWRRRSTRARR